MTSGTSSRSEFALLAAWPFAFGLVRSLVRLFVLIAFSEETPSAIGFLIGLPAQIATGLLIAVPLHLLQRTRWRWLVHALLLPLMFLSVVAFHYEAVFGRLPGVAMLYYLREARYLASSASAHAPLFAVAFETGFGWTLLVAAAEWVHVLQRWWRIPAACTLGGAALAIAFILRPSIVPPEHQWSARAPLLWALQSWSAQHSYTLGDLRISAGDVIRFQSLLGHRVPLGDDPRYPLCSERRGAGAPGNGRSVIFLILESVGTDELRAMPNLSRIARESVFFPAVKASGSKSVQAMPALFAGIPPQPAGHLLWKTPLPNVEGFPLLLRERGYATAYFHGGDLSFEQQRAFLRMAGFEELHEYEMFTGDPFIAWGHPDDVMFRRLQTWIAARDRSRPYLATLFTLSTHDPYVIPGRETSRPPHERFLETLHFLDAQLGAFYGWYRAHEAPHGTLLVITGDHAPHLAGARRLEDREVARFDVPLIVHGAAVGGGAPRSSVRAAQHDIPATILALTRTPRGRCDQGLDLLGGNIPNDRVLYSVAGDQLEDFHVWFPGEYVHLDLVTGTPRHERAREFFDLAYRLSAYLTRTDGFAPPPRTVRVSRKPLPRVTQPVVAAHRQNSRETIEEAIAAGFRWIEIDVNLTRDQVPVLSHDDVSAKTRAELDVLTLDEALKLVGSRARLMIELKPQGASLYANTMIALKSAALVRGAGTKIVADSYSPFIAASLKQHCHCEVGLDAPPRQMDSRWVDQAIIAGMDWIYVDHRQASKELIRYAHERGLRVLVFTVDDPSQLARLGEELPDGIILDRARLPKGLVLSSRAADAAP